MNEAIERMLTRYAPTDLRESECALREILQEIALVGLWRGKFFQKAAFYGGTALRIFYGLDRFSEVLDFTLLNKEEPFGWDQFSTAIINELKTYGFTVEFSPKNKGHISPIKSAFLKTNTIQGLLTIDSGDLVPKEFHPNTITQIKVEIDTEPAMELETGLHYLKDPIAVPITVVTEANLFAGKLHAALYRAWKNRVKGRDWYDVVWFLRKGTFFNPIYFSACMQANGELPHSKIISESELQALFSKRLDTLDIEAAKKDVRPFLRDASELDHWSVEFFTYWIQRIRFISVKKPK